MQTQTNVPLSTPSTLFLNGLRGFAAFLVVNAHQNWLYSNSTYSHALGYVGVDIFFVLSAFLLTRNLYKKMAQNREQNVSASPWARMLGVYFLRRFMRIYPLFFLFSLALAYLSNVNGNPALDHFFHVFCQGKSRYQFWPTVAFQEGHRHSIIWTLPVEIMYYFIIPFFVGAIVMAGPFWWLLNMTAACWSVIVSIDASRAWNSGIDKHGPTFVMGSVIGIFCAKIETCLKHQEVKGTPLRISPNTKKALDLATYFILFLCIDQAWYYNMTPFNLNIFPRLHRSLEAQFISLHVALIILKEVFVPSAISHLLENQILMYWGKISFCWYLVHMVSWKYYDPNVQPDYDALVFRFLRGIALSALLHYAVEKPIGDITQSLAKKLDLPRSSALLP